VSVLDIFAFALIRIPAKRISSCPNSSKALYVGRYINSTQFLSGLVRTTGGRWQSARAKISGEGVWKVIFSWVCACEPRTTNKTKATRWCIRKNNENSEYNCYKNTAF